MPNLNELYNSGVNIMEYFRQKNNTEENSSNSIMASYETQAGIYTDFYSIEGGIENLFYENFITRPMSPKTYLDLFTTELAKEFNKYEYSSVLEAGIGDGTTFVKLSSKLKDCQKAGFDIAPSRIKVAKKNAAENEIKNADFFVGNLQKMPLADNSFDIVYTVHAVEPNTNKEKLILSELYRVANKYIIMVEPSYELGNAETKANIDKHKYIKNLKTAIDELGYKILRYELFPIGTCKNQPAIYVIEKNPKKEEALKNYQCTICNEKLEFKNSHYYCSKCGLVYPVLDNIPILDSNRAIYFSKFDL